MVKPSEIYPKGTVVRLKKTGEMAIIRDHTYQYMGQNFLNYLAEISDREGLYALYHEEIDLECLPEKD